MKHTPISRRDFLKNLGIAGAGTLLAASPWLSAFSEVMNTSNEKCRLAIIGPGSRGRFLMGFLAKNPKVDIVALCDIYKPSIENALKLAPNAKVPWNEVEIPLLVIPSYQISLGSKPPPTHRYEHLHLINLRLT